MTNSKPAPDTDNTQPESTAQKRPFPGQPGYQRPSERMFRRSRAAQARRAKAGAGDYRLIMLLLQLSVLGALLLVGAGIFTQQALSGRGDMTTLAAITQPVLGPLSLAEIIGGGLVILLGGIMLIRFVRK